MKSGIFFKRSIVVFDQCYLQKGIRFQAYHQLIVTKARDYYVNVSLQFKSHKLYRNKVPLTI